MCVGAAMHRRSGNRGGGQKCKQLKGAQYCMMNFKIFLKELVFNYINIK